MDAKHSALVRAVEVYGDKLAVGPRRREQTLQGNVESGYCVWGRSHGGDPLGCLYRTRNAARAAIAAAEADAREANAHLIAAAPKMHAALQAVVDQGCACGGVELCIHELARAALAAVDGGGI